MGKPFNNIAVVGTGLLGTQIAMLSAYCGYKVCIYDVKEGAFDETYNKLFKDLKSKGVNTFHSVGQMADVQEKHFVHNRYGYSSEERRSCS